MGSFLSDFTPERFQGWVGLGPDSVEGKLDWRTFSPKPFEEVDIDVEITHCGICGSDLHTLRSGWGPTIYPCCVGHEIAGTVVKVGSQVKVLKIGDRVGIGAQVASCLKPDCEYCSTDEHQYCPDMVFTYNSKFSDGSITYGGYATHIRVPGNFAVKIPDGLRSVDAAAMMCGGVTAWNALIKNDVDNANCVGIIGFGGIGMFTLLWAKALGCKNIIVISRTSEKKMDAMKMGATKFIATEEGTNWAGDNAATIDLVISTVSGAKAPINHYLRLLRTHGRFVQVGLPDEPLPPVDAFPFLARGIRITGSFIGSPGDISEMLQFAAKKQIRPWIEERPLSSANEAILEMEKGHARYRYVLVNDSPYSDSEIGIRSLYQKSSVTLSEYIFARLKQLGIKSIHGVPGGYNLSAIECIPSLGLKWIGNCNELNAGYAADGYARVHGISALVTTYGVGELSALNAIAGAKSERVPVVHLVGTPSTQTQQKESVVQHSLGDADFKTYTRISLEVTCATIELQDKEEAPTQVDDIIATCWSRKLPVCIRLPANMANVQVNGARLEDKLELSIPENNPELEECAIDAILHRLQHAKNAVILVDGHAIRYGILQEVDQLVKRSALPVFISPMGKGGVNEQYELFRGLYAGNASQPGVASLVESSDLIIRIGFVDCDVNTCGFSYNLQKKNIIDIHPTNVTIGHSEYRDLHMSSVVSKLSESIPASSLPKRSWIEPCVSSISRGNSSPDITHEWFWSRVESFLRNDDIVVAEAGTSYWGIWDTKLPSGVSILNQVLWSSLGYSVGACQGAAQASRDHRLARRTILFVGDGGLQFSVQELSTMIRLKLRPLIFVISNSGYTTERYLHNEEAEYNDIQTWNLDELVSAFNDGMPDVKFLRVRTKADVDQLFDNDDFCSASHLTVVELIMPKNNVPRALKELIAGVYKVVI